MQVCREELERTPLSDSSCLNEKKILLPSAEVSKNYGEKNEDL